MLFALFCLIKWLLDRFLNSNILRYDITCNSHNIIWFTYSMVEHSLCLLLVLPFRFVWLPICQPWYIQITVYFNFFLLLKHSRFCSSICPVCSVYVKYFLMVLIETRKKHPNNILLPLFGVGNFLQRVWCGIKVMHWLFAKLLVRFFGVPFFLFAALLSCVLCFEWNRFCPILLGIARNGEESANAWNENRKAH